MPVYPSLKLTYFDFKGRAEATRVVLFIADIPFIDDRLTHERFAELKPTFPYGMVPVLEVDGEVIAESRGILRYAARLANMYPANDPVAALMVDELLAAWDEFFETLFMPSFTEKDADKKKHMREELLAGPLSKALDRMEARFAKTAQYPLFAKQPTKIFVHDVLAWDYVAMFQSGFIDHIPTTIMDKYPAMMSAFLKVAAHPRVQQWTSSVHHAPPKKLKLTYFDMSGRAEQIRLAFHIGGIAFEDERLTHEEFAMIKPSLPFEQVPVLQIDDDLVIAQSFPILRYAGTLAGLYPTTDPLRAARIDEVVGHVEELFTATGPSFLETDPEKKKQMRDVLTNETIPKALETLEKRIRTWNEVQAATTPSGSIHAVGGGMTIADLVVYSLVQFLQSGFMDHVPTTIADKYECVMGANKAVVSHPRVQDWYSTHKAMAP